MAAIGIDIESIHRFKNLVDHVRSQPELGVVGSIFTKEEIGYCLKKRHPHKHFAVRFAGKEAIVKAIGSGFRGEILFSEIGFVSSRLGQPVAKLSGAVQSKFEALNIASVDVSFSHSGEFAIAVAFLEVNT